jgi:uncharacterized protein (DUF983 family)
MKNKSALTAALECKCPRCRQGNMYKHPLVKLTKFTQMHQKCPVCGFHFEVEPGFYIGAMYVSYAFIVAFVLMTGIVLYNFFGDPETWVYIVTAPTVVLVMLPVIFRYSRSIYLYLMGGVEYREEYQK